MSIVSDQTKLSRTQTTNTGGMYDFVNLPIGSYTLTFSHDGFESQKIPSIVVQADRTATVNATLKVGQVGTTVTVEASPLMNGKLYRHCHSLTGRKRRTIRRDRREQWIGQSADLG